MQLVYQVFYTRYQFLIYSLKKNQTENNKIKGEILGVLGEFFPGRFSLGIFSKGNFSGGLFPERFFNKNRQIYSDASYF